MHDFQPAAGIGAHSYLATPVALTSPGPCLLSSVPSSSRLPHLLTPHPTHIRPTARTTFLSDPYKRIPFLLRNAATRERYLTGAGEGRIPALTTRPTLN